MATKQHPAFDSESNPQLVGGSVRTTAWSTDHIAQAAAAEGHHGTLWTAAVQEARSWKVREDGKVAPVLKTKWEDAKLSIEANSQILRNAVAAGHKQGVDAEALLANSNLLRQCLEETDGVARKANELPAIEGGEWKNLPRAYAAAITYLNAVDYTFDEQTFVEYFSSIQK